jgi:antitoxin component of RelBE/YafQ-DinJ toxin-antitoxin module
MNKKLQNQTLSLKISDTVKSKLEKISEEYGLSVAASLRLLITNEHSRLFPRTQGDKLEL